MNTILLKSIVIHISREKCIWTISLITLYFSHFPQTILAEYRIHNADIVLKYDATADDLIDVIEGNRVYIPCIYLLNKIGNYMFGL